MDADCNLEEVCLMKVSSTELATLSDEDKYM